LDSSKIFKKEKKMNRGDILTQENQKDRTAKATHTPCSNSTRVEKEETIMSNLTKLSM
jgi:hypothetical protein